MSEISTYPSLILLGKLLEQPFHAALLEENQSVLERPFAQLLAQGLAEIGPEDHYQPLPKGLEAWARVLVLQHSYLAHFDVFARVDLAAGTFADLDHDAWEDPRWSDLRLAIARFKGIPPERMVFLASLAEGSFFQEPHWTFDLALESPFFQLVHQLLKEHIRSDELGYADDQGTVSGEDVLADVACQGATCTLERLARVENLALETEFASPNHDPDDDPDDPHRASPGTTEEGGETRGGWRGFFGGSEQPGGEKPGPGEKASGALVLTPGQQARRREQQQEIRRLVKTLSPRDLRSIALEYQANPHFLEPLWQEPFF